MRINFTCFEPMPNYRYISYHIVTDLADVLSINLEARDISRELSQISEGDLVDQNKLKLPPECSPGVRNKTQALFCSHLDMEECEPNLPYYGYIRGVSRAPALYKGGLVVPTFIWKEGYNLIHTVIDPNNLPSVSEARKAGYALEDDFDYSEKQDILSLVKQSEHTISIDCPFLSDGYYSDGVLKRELKK